jgi:hypothetical protein
MSKFYQPWDSLKEVGDSFVVTNEKGLTHIRQLVYARNVKMKDQGMKYRHETIDVEGEKVLRVVRVA